MTRGRILENDVKKDRVNHIIEKVYANRYGLQVPAISPRQRSPFYINRVRPILARLELLAVLTRTKIVVSSLIFALLLLALTVYYHNHAGHQPSKTC